VYADDLSLFGGRSPSYSLPKSKPAGMFGAACRASRRNCPGLRVPLAERSFRRASRSSAFRQTVAQPASRPVSQLWRGTSKASVPISGLILVEIISTAPGAKSLILTFTTKQLWAQNRAAPLLLLLTITAVSHFRLTPHRSPLPPHRLQQQPSWRASSSSCSCSCSFRYFWKEVVPRS